MSTTIFEKKTRRKKFFYSHNFCTLLHRTQAKQKKDPDLSTNINFKFIGKWDDLNMRVEFMLLTVRKKLLRIKTQVDFSLLLSFLGKEHDCQMKRRCGLNHRILVGGPPKLANVFGGHTEFQYQYYHSTLLSLFPLSHPTSLGLILVKPQPATYWRSWSRTGTETGTSRPLFEDAVEKTFIPSFDPGR